MTSLEGLGSQGAEPFVFHQEPAVAGTQRSHCADLVLPEQPS